MKIYTRSGDDGTTGLFGGDRTVKDSQRVEAYGTIDELNACLGLAAATPDIPTALLTIVGRLQAELFEIGANLCTPPGKPNEHIPHVSAAHITQIENDIDTLSVPLPEMKHFILPGGSELAARLHLARTVCRRAEREIIALSREEEVAPLIVTYTNRLSDLLFVMARAANQAAGVEDVPWKP
ncbi:MAG: cob(I)yrinic acid a,c-diamide adenosyltransferase [Planctomycetota bacterium]|jgi:cob(I)alamin adenosyltransferase